MSDRRPADDSDSESSPTRDDSDSESPPSRDDPGSGSPPSEDGPDPGSPPSGDDPDDESASGRSPEELFRMLSAVDLRRAVLAITAVAILARLVGLGARPMHYDEGRVAYWVLHYADSGSFAYRHGIHGPFIQHVDRWLFALVGPSDFVARLPVALAGGLLPLVALLFRKHLRNAETVALALFLACNAILVYYSRFMRSDMLLAAFMFAALGCLVRFYDSRDVRYLYGVAVLAAFGFATKENAIVYVLTWIGATALLADQALYRPRRFTSGLALLWDRGATLRAAGRDRLLPYAGHALAATVVFLFLLVFMYADRGAGMAGIRRPPVPPGQGTVGFWEALSNPIGFPGYAYDTLAGAADEALRWGGRTGAGDSESLVDTYISHFKTDIDVLVSNAAVLLVFAVIGFVWERYGRGTSRNLVMFAGYCGFVSLLGYPLADDIGSAHWLHVHILVPLAIPAAVTAGRLYRWARTASIERDTVAAAAISLLLVLSAGAVAVGTVNNVYLDDTSQENKLVQYAQPESQFSVATGGITRIAGTNGNSPDVVLYTAVDYDGDRPIVSPPSEGNHSFILRPACSGASWYNAIPLNWYLASSDAEVTCLTDSDELASVVGGQQPPVVVTLETDGSVPTARLEESYVGRTFDVYQFGHRFTVYVHDDWTAEVPGWGTAGDAPGTPGGQSGN